MFIPSYKTVSEITDSPYKLSLMVAERARNLNDGAEPRIEPHDDNNITIAMKEIINGDIVEDKK